MLSITPECCFDDVSSLLQRLAVPIGAAEAHGLLSGLLCSQPSAHAKTRWFTELLDAAAVDPRSVVGQAGEFRALDSWFGATLASLNDAELGYMPLLPADNAAMAERLAALGDFCAGFNYGLGIGVGSRGDRALPDDTRELLRDFQAIDAAEPQSAGQGDESDFMELVEFVRVGVLLIHEELKPVLRVDGGSDSMKVH